MADDKAPGALDERTENTALGEALAAEHAAVWGYGVVGAALDEKARQPAEDAEAAHRDVRDQVTALLAERKADVVDAEGGYALPFPVLSAVDAAALGASSRTASPRPGCGCWTRRPSAPPASSPSAC